MGDLRFVCAAIAVFAAAFVGMSFGVPWASKGFSVQLSTAHRRSRMRLRLRCSRTPLSRRPLSALRSGHLRHAK